MFTCLLLISKLQDSRALCLRQTLCSLNLNISFRTLHLYDTSLSTLGREKPKYIQNIFKYLLLKFIIYLWQISQSKQFIFLTYQQDNYDSWLHPECGAGPPAQPLHLHWLQLSTDHFWLDGGWRQACMSWYLSQLSLSLPCSAQSSPWF